MLRHSSPPFYITLQAIRLIPVLLGLNLPLLDFLVRLIYYILIIFVLVLVRWNDRRIVKIEFEEAK